MALESWSSGAAVWLSIAVHRRVGASKQINIAEQTAAIKVCPVFMCFVLVDYRRSLDAVMQERKMMTLAVTMGTFGLLGCLSSAR